MSTAPTGDPGRPGSPSPATTVPVSVLVLTLDEEALLPRCLPALAWADEVLVVDSGSSDRTREVALAHGARVVEQPWLGWPGQRAAAVAAATHDWVMFVEADEVVTPPLARAVVAAMRASPDPRDGFSVDRRSEWLGRLLPNDQRRSMITSFVRLFHRGHSAYDADMVVHERVVVPGRRVLLDGTLIHWRQEDLTAMTARSTRYAALEARLADNRGTRGGRGRLALLPLLRLVWLLGPRRNLTLGTAGMLHGLHKATAEWTRQLALAELQGRGGLAPGSVASTLAEVNRAPAAAAGARRLIWSAAPRLLGLALRTTRSDPDDLAPILRAYAGWTRRWLVAGKHWADGHTYLHAHPPGHEPPEPPEPRPTVP